MVSTHRFAMPCWGRAVRAAIADCIFAVSFDNTLNDKSIYLKDSSTNGTAPQLQWASKRGSATSPHLDSGSEKARGNKGPLPFVMIPLTISLSKIWRICTAKALLLWKKLSIFLFRPSLVMMILQIVDEVGGEKQHSLKAILEIRLLQC